jgi:MerR family transcriptional regulator/heat shock protein HspR
MYEEVGISIEQGSDAKVLIISVAARLAGMHPQTLRQYDRLGLVQPGRAGGGGRRYSARDVALLREVQKLSQDEGVNLAGSNRWPNWKPPWPPPISESPTWSRRPRTPPPPT